MKKRSGEVEGPSGGQALQHPERRLRIDPLGDQVVAPPPRGQPAEVLETGLEAGAVDGMTAALNGPVLAMCVGPVWREAALGRGVVEARAPLAARLGGLVKALADEFAARRRFFVVDGVAAELLGSSVSVGAADVSLALRERAVFDVLARRPGVVDAKASLLAEVWGAAADDAHALEVTVGRLRRRLGPTGLGVQAVPRRGYRLTAG